MPWSGFRRTLRRKELESTQVFGKLNGERGTRTYRQGPPMEGNGWYGFPASGDL